MKVFTVHAAPDASGNLAEEAERMAFVKEGFSWPALFVPFLWLLWHRMWWVLLGWLGIGVSIGLASEFIPAAEGYMGFVGLLFGLLFALEANALRRWSLERKGWGLVGVATGRTREECERSFYTRWLEAAQPGAPVPQAKPAATSPPPRRDEPVIGLFPAP